MVSIFHWVQWDSIGLNWTQWDLLSEQMLWWLQLSCFIGTFWMWYLWLFQATAKLANRDKAWFAETSMPRTDSTCDNWETCYLWFPCVGMVLARALQSWTLQAFFYSALCIYANSQEKTCLEAQGDILMVPNIYAQGSFSLHCSFITYWYQTFLYKDTFLCTVPSLH
jgi:hypothetical protein